MRAGAVRARAPARATTRTPTRADKAPRRLRARVDPGRRAPVGRRARPRSTLSLGPRLGSSAAGAFVGILAPPRRGRVFPCLRPSSPRHSRPLTDAGAPPRPVHLHLGEGSRVAVQAWLRARATPRTLRSRPFPVDPHPARGVTRGRGEGYSTGGGGRGTSGPPGSRVRWSATSLVALLPGQHLDSPRSSPGPPHQHETPSPARRLHKRPPHGRLTRGPSGGVGTRPHPAPQE